MGERLTDEDLERLRQWAERLSRDAGYGRLDDDEAECSRLLPRLLSEVTDLRSRVERAEAQAFGLRMTAAEWKRAADGRLMERNRMLGRASRAEALIAEIRRTVEAERQAFGRSAFSDALWETLGPDDDATPPAEAAGAVEGGGAVSGEAEDAKSDTQTFSRPLMWAGLGKD